MKEMYLEGAQPFGEIVRGCSFPTDIDCFDVKPVLTELGVCYTLNSEGLWKTFGTGFQNGLNLIMWIYRKKLHSVLLF